MIEKVFVRSIALLMTMLTFAASAALAEESEVDRAKAQLNQQLADIRGIKPYVERQDLGRLRVLERSSQTTLDLIGSKGYGHRDTIHAYDLMMVTYNKSHQFLTFIRTEFTGPLLDSLWRTAQAIIESRGLPETSRMVFMIFEDMKHRVDDLLALNPPVAVKDRLTALISEFGNVIATARTDGDTPPTYTVATALYHHIVDLYPVFRTIADSNPMYDLTVDIMGLAEFYRELAHVESAR